MRRMEGVALRLAETCESWADWGFVMPDTAEENTDEGLGQYCDHRED